MPSDHPHFHSCFPKNMVGYLVLLTPPRVLPVGPLRHDARDAGLRDASSTIGTRIPLHIHGAPEELDTFRGRIVDRVALGVFGPEVFGRPLMASVYIVINAAGKAVPP